jgi:hypothetical protein
MLTLGSCFLPLQPHCSQWLRIEERLNQIYLQHPSYLHNDQVDERRQLANNQRVLQAGMTIFYQ